MKTFEQSIREWFMSRFERMPESDPSYFREWLDRFYAGTATDFMDSHSLQLWLKEDLQ